MTPKSNRPKKLRILIVDDHAVFRQGLSELINQESDLIVCGEAESAGEALRVIEATHPDVTVVDMSLKHSDGIDLAKDIRLRHPHLPVLILSMHDESLYAERALRAGALGYITKQEAADKVMSAIRCVSGGEVYVSAQFSRRMMRGLVGHGAGLASSPVEQLSDRELHVFRLLGQGHGTREIASEMHLSVSTVETHRANIKRKLHLHNSVELLQRAVRWVEREAKGA